MDFKTQSPGAGGIAAIDVDALLLVVAGAELPADLEPAVSTLVGGLVRSGDLALKAGSVALLHAPAGLAARRLVVAVAGDGSVKAWRKAVVAAVGVLKGGGAKSVAVGMAAGGDPSAEQAEALVGAVCDSLYVYRATKPSAPPAASLASFSLLASRAGAAQAREGLRRGRAIAAGVELARECANRPGNHCTPTYLAEQALALQRDHGLKVEVLERKDVARLGMGAFLAVAQGSAEPPKFIVMRWNGGRKGQAPVVLVGKGITFDTGGISIKPAAEMDEMKFDMGGAASVLGALRAVAELGAKVNVVGIIPACENMPGGRAVKPGDVVTSMSGQTIEILNTDAEGRLILCDALTYAKRFKPRAVVDVATLTGACVIALGHHRTGLFSTDDALAADLLAAGESALDPAWRLPIDEEYDEALKSNFADVANVGGRPGGAITAAMFLKRFASATASPWAHLDIAGTAWKSGPAKGATGRPVGLLTHFVLAQAGK